MSSKASCSFMDMDMAMRCPSNTYNLFEDTNTPLFRSPLSLETYRAPPDSSMNVTTPSPRTGIRTRSQARGLPTPSSIPSSRQASTHTPASLERPPLAPSNSSTGKKRAPSSAPKPPPSKKRRSTSTPPSQNIMASTPGSKPPATPTPAAAADNTNTKVPAANDDTKEAIKAMMEGITALTQSVGTLNQTVGTLAVSVDQVTQALGKVASKVTVHDEQLQEHRTKISALELEIEKLKRLVESNHRLTESFQKEWSNFGKEQLSQDRRSATKSTNLFSESSSGSSTASSWAGACPSSVPPVDENKEFVGAQVVVANAASLPPKTPKWHSLLRLKPTNDDKKELTSKEKNATLDLVLPPEKRAIAAYIKGSGVINKQLRGKEDVKDETKELVQKIGKAFARLPPCQGTVYRVTHLEEATIRKLKEPCKVFTDNAFLSSSELHYSHNNLLGHKANSNCCFTIVSKTGRSIIAFSSGAYQGEHEVLFLPNTKFSVKSHTMDDEMHHFEMEEL